MFFSFTPPPIYRKMREELATQLAQASSARPGELGGFLQKQPPSGGTSWNAQVGLVAIFTVDAIGFDVLMMIMMRCCN